MKLTTLLILSICAATAGSIPAPAMATTLRVPIQYPTIQAAINAAGTARFASDSILVAPGTYPENVTIAKSVFLIGEAGAASTRLEAIVWTLQNIDAPSTIAGLTITDSLRVERPPDGMYPFTLRQTIVEGPCTILFVARPMTVLNVQSCDFHSDVYIKHTGSAVQPRISSCRFHDANLTLEQNGNGWVEYCEFTNGILSAWAGDVTFVTGNHMTGGGILIPRSTSGPAIIEDNEVSGASTGIRAMVGYGCTVNGNRVWGCDTGITVEASSSSGSLSLGGNLVWNCGDGIVVQPRNPATLAGNTVALCSGDGFRIGQANIVRFQNNISAVNGTGVRIEQPQSQLTLLCNDVCCSSTANWWGIPSPLGTNGNFAEDPLFCDAPAGDFHIAESSLCAPANSPSGCGLIGALGTGCAPVSVQPSSWGQVKARYGAR